MFTQRLTSCPIMLTLKKNFSKSFHVGHRLAGKAMGCSVWRPRLCTFMFDASCAFGKLCFSIIRGFLQNPLAATRVKCQLMEWFTSSRRSWWREPFTPSDVLTERRCGDHEPFSATDGNGMTLSLHVSVSDKEFLESLEKPRMNYVFNERMNYSKGKPYFFKASITDCK